jgi:hypothetical protein
VGADVSVHSARDGHELVHRQRFRTALAIYAEHFQSGKRLR